MTSVGSPLLEAASFHRQSQPLPSGTLGALLKVPLMTNFTAATQSFWLYLCVPSPVPRSFGNTHRLGPAHILGLV